MNKENIFNMIPFYEALISGVEDGILDISLVDFPAVESNFLAFKEQKAPINFRVENEEQHIITGVIMRCNYPIYRFDEMRGEYYIVYSKETIELMSKKMMQDGNHNNITLMHIEGSEVDGVELMEIFIKNSEKGISPIGFEDIEEYSLFATYKVENPEIWSKIKDGTFKGFSLSGLFEVKKMEDNNNNNMSIKNTILNSMVQFGEIATDKGLIYWTGDEDYKIGDEIFIGEEKNTAEDGDYILEDGTIIRVVEGKIAEIIIPEIETEAEVEEKEDEETTDETPEVEETEPETEEVEPEVEDKPVEDTIVEEVVEETPEVEDEKTEYVTREEFEELRKEVEELKVIVSALQKELEKPAVEPIVEEFKVVEKKEKGKSSAGRIIGALKNW